jgi:hypothetical protein
MCEPPAEQPLMCQSTQQQQQQQQQQEANGIINSYITYTPTRPLPLEPGGAQFDYAEWGLITTSLKGGMHVILEHAAVHGSFTTWSTLQHLGPLVTHCYDYYRHHPALLGVLQRMALLATPFLAKAVQKEGADDQGLHTRWAAASILFTSVGAYSLCWCMSMPQTCCWCIQPMR